MPYELNAVIGPFDLLRSRTAGIREAVVAPLRQSMGLVPVTEELLAELTGPPTGLDGTGPECRPLGALFPAFGRIPSRTSSGTLDGWAPERSIAHVEADFHGGHGHQAAVVYGPGAKVWGPLRDADFTGPREEWPINAALALLGVVPDGAGGAEEADHQDLFLAVGLGREQDTAGWHSLGLSARWAASYEEWYGEQAAETARTARAAAEFERRRRLPDVPAALDGKEIMDLLGLPPGPRIGAATRHLQNLHLERGPLAREEAVTLLRDWALRQVVTDSPSRRA
ncbi:hypothetical protein [Kitasatospora purpeofusca]|uniref:hypothetical protein n=1 Tax=Kitasatospora purpeofusca TaxID=67352 RepID=UPI000A9D16FF|nr:hypothetical protein [Kitasatospora purpeofusca]